MLYLNQHTVAEVQFMALELGYIADEGVEIVLPTVYGEESAQEKAPAASKTRKWDEADTFAVLGEHCSPAVVQAIRQLYQFALARGAEPRFGRTILPSVTMRLPLNGTLVSTFSLSELPATRGNLQVFLADIDKSGVALEAQTAFTACLLAIPGVTFKTAKYPNISIDECLTPPAALVAVENALDALLKATNSIVVGDAGG